MLISFKRMFHFKKAPSILLDKKTKIDNDFWRKVAPPTASYPPLLAITKLASKHLSPHTALPLARVWNWLLVPHAIGIARSHFHFSSLLVVY